MPFKTFTFLFIFACISHMNAQVVKVNFDRQLVYKIEGDERSIVFYYNSKTQDPIVSTQFVNSWEIDNYVTAFWNYNYKGKIYRLGGDIVNGKYFTGISYSVDGDGMYPDRAYELSDELWEIPPYDDCKMVWTEVENQAKIRAFFTNRKDGEDYSIVNNYILKSHSLPAITNLNQIIEKGWVLIYADIYMDNEINMSILGTLQTIDSTDKPSFVYNLDEINYTLNADKEYDLKSPYPVYCEVFGLNEGVDEATYEKINEFFGEMCSYYNYFGRYDLKEFQEFFKNEIDKKSNFYKTEGILNSKQINTFKKELSEYISSNEKANLMTQD